MLNIALQQKSKGDRDVGVGGVGGKNPNLSRNDSILFLQTETTSKKLSLCQQRMEIFQIPIHYCVLAIPDICEFW